MLQLFECVTNFLTDLLAAQSGLPDHGPGTGEEKQRSCDRELGNQLSEALLALSTTIERHVKTKATTLA